MKPPTTGRAPIRLTARGTQPSASTAAPTRQPRYDHHVERTGNRLAVAQAGSDHTDTQPGDRAGQQRQEQNGRGDHRRVPRGPRDPADRAAEQQGSPPDRFVMSLVGHPRRREQPERHRQQQQQRRDITLHGRQVGKAGRRRQLSEPRIGLQEVGQRDGQQPDQQKVRGQRQSPADERRQRPADSETPDAG